jgi:hypothetical protein
MTLEAIVAGDFGQPYVFTVLDVDTEAAADVSAYTTSQQVQLKFPKGSLTALIAGSFVDDGSDGEVTWTPTSSSGSNSIPVGGQWQVRTRLTGSSKVLTSTWLLFDVEA